MVISRYRQLITRRSKSDIGLQSRKRVPLIKTVNSHYRAMGDASAVEKIYDLVVIGAGTLRSLI